MTAVFTISATAQQTQAGSATLSANLQKQIDSIANAALNGTGVPSASVVVVKDGQIAYAHAYGNAHLAPNTAATTQMRYSIGSISKQFTATAILMLAEQGKLSLDDPVSRFVPNLTRGNEVTIREILSHTSGYQDYWPQDYVPPMMLKPISAQGILDRWARIPLDFDPGTKWQYSNTNYVIAGLIVEKVSGMKLLLFLQKNIFAPLHMQSVMNVNENHLQDTDATGYLRYALGPDHPAPKEGRGWLFAMGELAMPATDLARWDIGMMDEKLLKPASYQEMETDVRLKNGECTNYGLGIGIGQHDGHRMLEHDGEVSGFVADNKVFPDDRAAVVVLTNLDASGAASQIGGKISKLLFAEEDKNTDQRLQLAREIFTGLQQGKIDRSLFTANANAYFSAQALADFASSLGPLGPPQDFSQTTYRLRGGMGFRLYNVKFRDRALDIWEREMPDGKIEQFQVMPAE